MDIGVSFAGYVGFLSDDDLCLCQAEDSDEDVRESRERGWLDVQTMRLQPYEAVAYACVTN